LTAVTVTGGPFTDGQGNPLTGSWQLQPVPQQGTLSDAQPLPAWGRLGDTNAPGAGEFSAVVAEGNYVFHLRMATQEVEQLVTVAYSNGATQTIESLVASAQG
jgi:hypothetical protein